MESASTAAFSAQGPQDGLGHIPTLHAFLISTYDLQLVGLEVRATADCFSTQDVARPLLRVAVDDTRADPAPARVTDTLYDIEHYTPLPRYTNYDDITSHREKAPSIYVATPS